jgi:N6-L-threonylcarbamoyladenine synthase
VRILGVETSCDETAAALVQDGRKVLSSVVASQRSLHRPFRGVVPELASRAHVERINDVIEEALRNVKAVDAIAVTIGPGLIGCLLVGAATARMLGWAWKVPVVGINHLEGHLFAGLVQHPNLEPPFLGLVVSGGHTELVIFEGYGRYKKLGATRDDAAGEAFDKVAKLLDLPFPGGPAVERSARRGNPGAIAFPRAWLPGTHDFSFSGIKTSVINYLKAAGHARHPVADIAASFQEAVVDVLVKKTLKAAESHHLSSVVVGGGVAANDRLRRVFLKTAKKKGIKVFLPDPSFCTDNAVMTAAAGYYKLKRTPHRKIQGLRVDDNLAIQNWNMT